MESYASPCASIANEWSYPHSLTGVPGHLWDGSIGWELDIIGHQGLDHQDFDFICSEELAGASMFDVSIHIPC